ncbi:MAG: hypothetical protein ACTSSG_06540 [Candidatus Heimdallarchaeaceae archaeon]
MSKVLTISIFLFLLASTNSFNAFFSNYYDLWVNELNKENTPEFQLNIMGKLNESFLHQDVLTILNDTYFNTISIKEIFSLTTLSSNFFNLSYSLTNGTSFFINDFVLYVFSNSLLKELSLSINNSSIIISESLLSSLENITILTMTSKNEKSNFANYTIGNIINSKIFLNKYFLDINISLSPEKKWLVMDYSGFFKLIREIRPEDWINYLNIDCKYSSIYSVELNLSNYKNLRPKKIKKEFNSLLHRLTHSIFNLYQKVDDESEFVFSQVISFLRFEIQDSFNFRLNRLFKSIKPFFYLSLLLFIVLQAIFLSIIIPILRTYLEDNQIVISLSHSRGLTNKDIRISYYLSFAFTFLPSAFFCFIFQVIFFSFKKYFLWKEMHLTMLYVVLYYIFFFIFVVYSTKQVFNKILKEVSIPVITKQRSRSEKILIYLRYSSVLIIPIVILLFLVYNLRILNTTNIPISYIFLLSIAFVLFAFLLVKLPKNILTLSSAIVFFILKPFSYFCRYLQRATKYYLSRRKQFSTLLFFLFFILNMTLLIYDSSSYQKTRLINSSYGYDVMIKVNYGDFQILTSKMKSINNFTIYEIPGNELISTFYLVDTPLSFYEGCIFYNNYFSFFNNNEIFIQLEEDSNFIVSSISIKNTLNLEIGDLFFPFKEEVAQELNFTFLDFAGFLPIITSVNSGDSWILGNYHRNLLSTTINNSSKVYFSFELYNNISISDISSILSEEGLIFDLVYNEVNPYVSHYSELDNFQKNQIKFLVSLNAILALVITFNLSYYLIDKNTKAYYYFISHGYKPSDTFKADFISNSLLIFLLMSLNLVFCIFFYYLIAFTISKVHGLFLNIFLSKRSIFLLTLPFIMFIFIFNIFNKIILKKEIVLTRGIENGEKRDYF